MTADLAPVHDRVLETPNVMCVSIAYAHTHLSELLQFTDEGGYVLIRDGRSPRRGYWLTTEAPGWWAGIDDTEQWVTRRQAVSRDSLLRWARRGQEASHARD